MANLSKKEANMAARANTQLPEVENTPPEVGVRAVVLDDFEHSHSMWRTAEGIAAQTSLPVDKVNLALKTMSELLIRSALPDDKGRTHYTTLGNYRAHAGILRRVLSALS